MKTDIEISQSAKLKDINIIAKEAGIKEKYLIAYGKDKAKIDDKIFLEKKDRKGKLILVTAINPTPAGEGKTTTTIGLSDALHALGKNVMTCLREPSLGPVFGLKGGACGAGYAQVVPMDDINLHFTGDIHAVTACNNLISAIIDNHIHQGNALHINPKKIIWHRCLDINDRQLRYVVDGLGGKSNGDPREDSFDISVASEIMAVLCLSQNLHDLKERLGRIIVAYSDKNKPVTVNDFGIVGSLTVLLKDAIKPNLVQTLEGTPALIHGGPFANIAHGCNSIIATKLAMKLSDYVITEAGFGADLGAEKFLDIVCRQNELKPDGVVIVASIRALKHHGGCKELNKENIECLKEGMKNLYRHLDNIHNVYHLPVVVCVNRFTSDTDSEIKCVLDSIKDYGYKAVISEVYAKGSKGGIDLGKAVIEMAKENNIFTYAYEDELPIKKKIEAVAKKIYHAKKVEFSSVALKELRNINKLGFSNLPVCIAKTQYSFSDNPKLLSAPEDFTVTITNLKVSAGAGFVVAYSGSIMTMPGLPKKPAAELIDIDDNGYITGLF